MSHGPWPSSAHSSPPCPVAATPSRRMRPPEDHLQVAAARRRSVAAALGRLLVGHRQPLRQDEHSREPIRASRSPAAQRQLQPSPYAGRWVNLFEDPRPSQPVQEDISSEKRVSPASPASSVSLSLDKGISPPPPLTRA